MQQCNYSVYVAGSYSFSPGNRDSIIFYDSFRPAGPLPPGGRFRLAYGVGEPGCGISPYEYVIGAVWDGRRLIRLPLLESGADGAGTGMQRNMFIPVRRAGRPGG